MRLPLGGSALTKMQAEEESTQHGQKHKGLLQWAGLTCFLVVIDQASKAIVRTTLSPGSCRSLLDDILYVTFVPNYQGFSWFVPALPEWVKPLFLLLRLSIFVLAFPVYEFYMQSGQGSRWAWAALLGISAGTLGNLLDDLFVLYTC
jgi:lipoprotein signal peptidase